VTAPLEALLASFDEQIRAIEADIKTLVQAYQPVAQAVKALLAVPGVGRTIAAARSPSCPSSDRCPAEARSALTHKLDRHSKLSSKMTGGAKWRISQRPRLDGAAF
jgi:hypothetical protein